MKQFHKESLKQTSLKADRPTILSEKNYHISIAVRDKFLILLLLTLALMFNVVPNQSNSQLQKNQSFPEVPISQ